MRQQITRLYGLSCADTLALHLRRLIDDGQHIDVVVPTSAPYDPQRSGPQTTNWLIISTPRPAGVRLEPIYQLSELPPTEAPKAPETPWMIIREE